MERELTLEEKIIMIMISYVLNDKGVRARTLSWLSILPRPTQITPVSVYVHRESVLMLFYCFIP